MLLSPGECLVEGWISLRGSLAAAEKRGSSGITFHCFSPEVSAKILGHAGLFFGRSEMGL